MKKLILAPLALLLLLWFKAAVAIEPFVITDIRVEGLERLEAGTVFNYLPLKVGDELNDEEARLSIKELFGTGFFKSVELEQDGTVLVVVVVERPSISELTISGNRALDTDALNEGLEQAGLVQGRIFNSASLDRVEQEIKNTYLSLGRYSATVDSEVEALERNRVAIKLKINEGRIATIKNINILGAKTVPVRTLKDEMSLSDKRGWNLFTRRDQYSKQKLEADIESIRSYYLDRGYHDFEIVSRSVEISPNKQNIFISISIDEGAQYVFGDTVFEIATPSEVAEGALSDEVDTATEADTAAAAGTATATAADTTTADETEAADGAIPTEDESVRDFTTTPIPADEVAALKRLVTIEPGTPFSRKAVTASRNAIAAKYSDEGYAFVNVRPIYETDRDAGVVKTVFAIEPKQRVYVRKVEITGNLYTRDQVIRRELRQFEGAWYSAEAVKLSKDRLQRTGYFSSVSIETPPVPGTTDQVDMKVVVNETNTGSVSFSVGYSEEDGAAFGVGFKQRNLFGTGRELEVDVGTNDSTESLTLKFVNPFHTPDGVSRALHLSSRRTDTDKVNTAKYKVDTTRGGVDYNIPIAENNSLDLGISVEDLQLHSATPPQLQAVIADKPDGINLVAKVGVSRDTLDSFFFPTRGNRRSLSLEFSAPGSEYEYYKVSFDNTYFIPLGERYTFKGSLNIGFGGGYGDFSKSYLTSRTVTVAGVSRREEFQDRLPFFKHYFAGGSNSVRGFDGRSLGPLENVGGGDPLGGDQRLLVNAELLFPPFGGSEAGHDKRFGVFIDGGMVFGEGYTIDGEEFPTSIDPGELRYSAGLTFNWISPIGPFAMSYAQPLNEEDGDDTESFQITVGSVFH